MLERERERESSRCSDFLNENQKSIPQNPLGCCNSFQKEVN